MPRKFAVWVVLCATLMSPLQVAEASEVDALIEKLVEKKILTRMEAESLRAEAESGEKKSFKQHVNETTPWLEGISQQGDIRLRYEGFALEDEDGRDRQRGRFRLRWGLEKKFNDEFRAGFRLASGTQTEATSTNQSFDDEFNAKSIFIDRAYAIYTPTNAVKELIPAVSNVEIGAGKVGNPHEKWGTSIVWDGDVNPEGVYEKLDLKLADVGTEGKWELNSMMSQFVLDEQSTRQDSQLLGYGIGTTYAWDKNHNIFFNYTFYDWQDYENVITPSPGYASVLTATNPGGNDRGVDDFDVHSYYIEHNTVLPTLLFGNQPYKLFGHYIQNDGIQNEGLIPNWDEDEGYSAGVTIGKAKKQGEWEAKYQYYYLEANATAGNFTESDLGLGFTNNKGHQLSYAYRLRDNIQLQLTYWDVERIRPLSLSADSDSHVSRWQADIIYSF